MYPHSVLVVDNVRVPTALGFSYTVVEWRTPTLLFMVGPPAIMERKLAFIFVDVLNSLSLRGSYAMTSRVG